MSDSCTNLATKAELSALRSELANKPNKSEVNEMVTAATSGLSAYLLAKIVGVEDIAKVAQTVGQSAKSEVASVRVLANTAKSSASAAMQSSVAAANTAKQATYDALYAQTRASSAANLARTAGSNALKAISQVASIFGIIATFASLVQLTALTIQVVRLEKQVQGLRESTEEAQRQTREAKAAAAASDERAANAIKIANAANLKANEAEKKVIEIGAEINQVRQEANQAIKAANQATKEANAAKSEANAAKLEANQATSDANVATEAANRNNSKITDLESENSSLKSRIASFEQQRLSDQSRLNELSIGLDSAIVKIPSDEDIKIVRKVAETTVINTADIRDFNGKLVGLASNFGTQVTELGRTVKRTVGQVKAETKDEIKNYIKTLPGVNDDNTIKPLEESKVRKIVKEELANQPAQEPKIKKLIETEVERQISKEPRIKEIIKTEVVKEVRTESTREILKTELKTEVKTELRTEVVDQTINEPRIKELLRTEVETQTKPLKDSIKVNDEQVKNLDKKITDADTKISKLPDAATIAIAVGGLDIIRQIKDNSAKVSPCQAPVYVPPVGTQVAAVNTALVAFDLAAMNRLASITTTVSSNNRILANGVYGLRAIQNFASKAWKAATNDKVINGLNLVVGLHNAVMLSNNIASTLGDTVSIGLGVLGIKDAEDNLIDVNGIIKAKLTNLISSIIGTENYTQLTATLAKVNRIYQAGQNILSTVTSIGDNAKQIRHR